MKNRKDLVLKITLTALFSALCFALTFVQVPLPTGAKVHLGNFVCVLAALLLGPVVGGITGSLGMGLNDIAGGYGWDTILRTFIVKFILGFSVGILFKLLIKKDKASRVTLYSITSVFGLSFILFLFLYIFGKDSYDKKGNFEFFIRAYKLSESQTIKISILVPIFLGVFFLILTGVIVFLAILKKKNKEREKIYLAVSTVTAISVIINTLGEFFLRWFLKGFITSFNEGFIESVTKLPSNIITGVVTIVFVTVIYFPLYLALHSAGFDKFIIHPTEELEENQEIDIEVKTNEA